jgi:hypothetical protein
MDLIAHDGKSRMLRGAALALACALALSACKGKRRNVCPAGESEPWKFGVMADSQWTAGDDGKNPHSVAAGIIGQLNQEFIAHGVRLVVAVGDLADNACTAIPCPQMQTRAAFAQALYDAGIGFYPLRGNHDDSVASALELQRLFPQTQNGVNNATPQDALQITFKSGEIAHPAKSGSEFTLGCNFESPPEVPGLLGLSYAFDHANVRFILLDQFSPTDSSLAGIDRQLSWIARALSGRPAGGHAVVFGHKHLISDYHGDTLFGANPASDPHNQDEFIAALANNDVRYYVGGHDHMHLDSIFWTTDNVSAYVHDLVTASASSKFYTPIQRPASGGAPAVLDNDEYYDVPAFGRQRQQRVAEELYTIGYYIFTVDGPRLTIEYYAAAPESWSSGGAPPSLMTATPELAGKFVRRSTAFYSLNGTEFIIPQGASYSAVFDTYATGGSATNFMILDGANGSVARDPTGAYPLVKAVNTGWTAKSAPIASDAVTLWGMADLGATSTDVYVIQMSYDEWEVGENLPDGSFGMVALDESGNWVKAVSLNSGGTEAFVAGAYSSESFTLGSHGVDAAAGAAWAVVNFNGTFAVARFDGREPETHDEDPVSPSGGKRSRWPHEPRDVP